MKNSICIENVNLHFKISLKSSKTSCNNLFFFLSLFNLFIFDWVGSSLLCVGFSLVGVSGGYSLVWCAGVSLWWLLLLQSTGPRCVGFSSVAHRL